MNALPPELRTPPLPVVALVGCAELHKELGAYFNANLRPPLFSVGLAEANESLLGRLFGSVRQAIKPFSTPDGILKADWFLKQRQRRAAVAVAFVPRADVDGDPSSWMRMLAGLRAIKAASAGRDVALLVVVVQEGAVTPLPQDRLAGLWSSAEPKQLVVISRLAFSASLAPEQRRALQEEQLRPLGQMVLEAAGAYYAAAAARLRQRQLDLASSLGAVPPEVSAAIAFKLAVLAEFRQDWLGAVASYQAAAAALAGVPLGAPAVSCQRHAEVAAVAEVVHFKAMMLLLHQQRYGEAVAQLNSHLATFGRLPDGLPLPAAAAHYGWLARQYQTAAEMIAGSRMDAATLQAHKEVDGAHLLVSAAQLALTRKAVGEQLSQLRCGAAPAFDASSVKKGRCLGQVERRQPGETPQARGSDLTDAEYCQCLEAEEFRVNHCQAVLDLLLQAQAMHLRQQPGSGPAPAALPPAAAGPQQQQAAAASKRSSRAAVDRVSARLAYLIAEQQAETHNLTAARKLLLQVAYTYRRDGWDVLLLHGLLLLRDVCQRLKLHKESLLHSLEIASLATSLAAAGTGSSGAVATGLFDEQQAQALASAAVMGLLGGPTDHKSSLKKTSIVQQSPGAAAAAPEQQPQQQPDTSVPPAPAADTAAAGADGSGSSSSRWDYAVQHLDLAAAVQQLPPGRDDAAALSNSIAEVLLLHKQQDFGWWRLITVAGGFVAHSADPQQLCLCVALLNNTPVGLPLQSATLAVADSQGNCRLQLHMGQPAPEGSSEAPAQEKQQQEQQPGWPLQLQPGRWQQLHVVFTPRCISSIVCEQLELLLSPQVCITLRVASFPPGRPVLGSSVLPAAAGDPFSLQQQVKLGAWSAKVQHVGLLPAVQLLQPELLLMGEFVPLEIRVDVSAAQPPSSLELSVRAAGTGAVPRHLTLLAAAADGKLHEVSLEGQVLALPKLPPGSSWTQRLWARSSTVQDCRVSAVLSSPALVPAHADLAFRQPFEHRVRLSTEAGVHTLLAPSPAFETINGSSLATAAVDGGSTASGDAVPLVVGQSVLAQVLVAVSCPAELLLLDADVELQQESGLKLLNKLSDQLLHKPLPASAGSVHSLLLQLVPTANVAAPVAAGRLKLMWRRRQPAAVAAHGGATSSSAGATAAAADGLAVCAAPSADVETCLDLPQVLVQDSLLSIRASAPQHVTAGLPFAFTMQVHNMTSQAQEVQLSVHEAQGFVFSGAKQQVLSLAARSTQNIAWTLVAHASGQLQLPAVRVSCPRLCCSAVTQGCDIHVMAF